MNNFFIDKIQKLTNSLPCAISDPLCTLKRLMKNRTCIFKLKPVHPDVIEKAISKRLARFKQPRKLFAIDSLPRNAMGKVQKNILRDEFGSTFQDLEK